MEIVGAIDGSERVVEKQESNGTWHGGYRRRVARHKQQEMPIKPAQFEDGFNAGVRVVQNNWQDDMKKQTRREKKKKDSSMSRTHSSPQLESCYYDIYYRKEEVRPRTAQYYFVQEELPHKQPEMNHHRQCQSALNMKFDQGVTEHAMYWSSNQQQEKCNFNLRHRPTPVVGMNASSSTSKLVNFKIEQSALQLLLERTKRQSGEFSHIQQQFRSSSVQRPRWMERNRRPTTAPRERTGREKTPLQKQIIADRRSMMSLRSTEPSEMREEEQNDSDFFQRRKWELIPTLKARQSSKNMPQIVVKREASPFKNLIVARRLVNDK